MKREMKREVSDLAQADALRLELFGGARITRNGTPLAGFVSSKVQALLCYLAVTGRAHSRAELAGLLWGEMDDAGAAANLRKALSNLHRLIPAHMTISRHEVAFNRQAAYWLDVEAFSAP